jgi:trehalose/maltose hydrolase-like predicted phosphorylase
MGFRRRCRNRKLDEYYSEHPPSFQYKTEYFLQQDDFLDKDLKKVSKIPKDERPINQYWSWDRILRSPYIKQADKLQIIYRNNDFGGQCRHRTRSVKLKLKG